VMGGRQQSSWSREHGSGTATVGLFPRQVEASVRPTFATQPRRPSRGQGQHTSMIRPAWQRTARRRLQWPSWTARRQLAQEHICVAALACTA
jgi:hypothetical protein